MSRGDRPIYIKHENPQPIIILVDPQMGENIGSAARGMLNFGLENMRLVNPRDGWPNEKAVATASGAAIVLDGINVFPDLESSVSDLNYVFATSARNRDLSKEVMNIEEAMKYARKLIQSGLKVGILFGAERSGLENNHVVISNSLISIPVNSEFASLNLAQTVMLTAYEWRRTGLSIPVSGELSPELITASQKEMESLYEHFSITLDEAGFFYPPSKVKSMRLNFRNMLSRMAMTNADVKIFHGILRQFVRWKDGL
ncbi:MAG: RNA methyltransferase [Proteobacteria bacterium]|nr:RNA methyltransferase [Pseudomonadota bacterium]